MRRKKVLIIEDDQAIREIISYLLLSEGYEPLGCERPGQLEDILGYEPELILLDEWVDAREGTMLCQEIRLIHRLAGVPVIIISTSADIEQIALSCKADGFVRKPFAIHDMLAEIKRCLDN
jgi:DNA-binding response OmpR family regulator